MGDPSVALIRVVQGVGTAADRHKREGKQGKEGIREQAEGRDMQIDGNPGTRAARIHKLRFAFSFRKTRHNKDNEHGAPRRHPLLHATRNTAGGTGSMGGGTQTKRVTKRRAKTAGPTVNRGASRGGGGAGGGFLKSRDSSSLHAVDVAVKKIDVRFGNKEGGGTHFGSEERFAWQKAQYASDAMYTMPAVKAPPFSFGTSTRADWKKIMENTKDLHNPNGELCELLVLLSARSACLFFVWFSVHLRSISAPCNHIRFSTRNV